MEERCSITVSWNGVELYPSANHLRTPSTLSTLITCITQPLTSLGFNGLHDLTFPNGTHIITLSQLKEKFSSVTAKIEIALNKLAALLSLTQEENLTPSEVRKL